MKTTTLKTKTTLNQPLSLTTFLATTALTAGLLESSVYALNSRVDTNIVRARTPEEMKTSKFMLPKEVMQGKGMGKLTFKQLKEAHMRIGYQGRVSGARYDLSGPKLNETTAVGAVVEFKRAEGDAAGRHTHIMTLESLENAAFAINRGIIRGKEIELVAAYPGGFVNAKGGVTDVARLTVVAGRADVIGNKIKITVANPDAFVVNNGIMSIEEAGISSFVAPNVVQNGSLLAVKGKVIVGEGGVKEAVMDLYGDGKVHVTSRNIVDPQVASAIAQELLNGAAEGTWVISVPQFVDTLRQLIQADNNAAPSGIVVENVTRAQDVVIGHKAAAVRVDGNFMLRDANQNGGRMKVEGNEIVIGKQTQINVDGQTRGGDVYIGGVHRGGRVLKDSVRIIEALRPDADFIIKPEDNTQKVTVQKGATFTLKGSDQGGRFVVWAEEEATGHFTDVNLSSSQGKGGSFEFSAKKIAPKGLKKINMQGATGSGQGLVDPMNVVFVNAAPAAVNNIPWSPTQNVVSAALTSSFVVIPGGNAGAQKDVVVVPVPAVNANSVSYLDSADVAPNIAYHADGWIVVNNIISPAAGSLTLLGDKGIELRANITTDGLLSLKSAAGPIQNHGAAVLINSDDMAGNTSLIVLQAATGIGTKTSPIQVRHQANGGIAASNITNGGIFVSRPNPGGGAAQTSLIVRDAVAMQSYNHAAGATDYIGAFSISAPGQEIYLKNENATPNDGTISLQNTNVIDGQKLTLVADNVVKSAVGGQTSAAKIHLYKLTGDLKIQADNIDPDVNKLLGVGKANYGSMQSILNLATVAVSEVGFGTLNGDVIIDGAGDGTGAAVFFNRAGAVNRDAVLRGKQIVQANGAGVNPLAAGALRGVRSLTVSTEGTAAVAMQVFQNVGVAADGLFNIDTLMAALNAGGGTKPLSFISGAGLTIGEALTNAQALSLTSTTGDFTVSHGVTTTAGNLSLTALRGKMIGVPGEVARSAGDLYLTAQSLGDRAVVVGSRIIVDAVQVFYTRVAGGAGDVYLTVPVAAANPLHLTTALATPGTAAFDINTAAAANAAETAFRDWGVGAAVTAALKVTAPAAGNLASAIAAAIAAADNAGGGAAAKNPRDVNITTALTTALSGFGNVDIASEAGDFTYDGLAMNAATISVAANTAANSAIIANADMKSAAGLTMIALGTITGTGTLTSAGKMNLTAASLGTALGKLKINPGTRLTYTNVANGAADLYLSSTSNVVLDVPVIVFPAVSNFGDVDITTTGTFTYDRPIISTGNVSIVVGNGGIDLTHGGITAGGNLTLSSVHGRIAGVGVLTSVGAMNLTAQSLGVDNANPLNLNAVGQVTYTHVSGGTDDVYLDGVTRGLDFTTVLATPGTAAFGINTPLAAAAIINPGDGHGGVRANFVGVLPTNVNTVVTDRLTGGDTLQQVIDAAIAAAALIAGYDVAIDKTVITNALTTVLGLGTVDIKTSAGGGAVMNLTATNIDAVKTMTLTSAQELTVGNLKTHTSGHLGVIALNSNGRNIIIQGNVASADQLVIRSEDVVGGVYGDIVSTNVVNVLSSFGQISITGEAIGSTNSPLKLLHNRSAQSTNLSAGKNIDIISDGDLEGLDFESVLAGGYTSVKATGNITVRVESDAHGGSVILQSGGNIALNADIEDSALTFLKAAGVITQGVDANGASVKLKTDELWVSGGTVTLGAVEEGTANAGVKVLYANAAAGDLTLPIRHGTTLSNPLSFLDANFDTGMKVFKDAAVTAQVAFANAVTVNAAVAAAAVGGANAGTVLAAVNAVANVNPTVLRAAQTAAAALGAMPADVRDAVTTAVRNLAPTGANFAADVAAIGVIANAATQTQVANLIVKSANIAGIASVDIATEVNRRSGAASTNLAAVKAGFATGPVASITGLFVNNIKTAVDSPLVNVNAQNALARSLVTTAAALSTLSALTSVAAGSTMNAAGHNILLSTPKLNQNGNRVTANELSLSKIDWNAGANGGNGAFVPAPMSIGNVAADFILNTDLVNLMRVGVTANSSVKTLTLNNTTNDLTFNQLVDFSAITAAPALPGAAAVLNKLTNINLTSVRGIFAPGVAAVPGGAALIKYGVNIGNAALNFNAAANSNIGAPQVQNQFLVNMGAGGVVGVTQGQNVFLASGGILNLDAINVTKFAAIVSGGQDIFLKGVMNTSGAGVRAIQLIARDIISHVNQPNPALISVGEILLNAARDIGGNANAGNAFYVQHGANGSVNVSRDAAGGGGGGNVGSRNVTIKSPTNLSVGFAQQTTGSVTLESTGGTLTTTNAIRTTTDGAAAGNPRTITLTSHGNAQIDGNLTALSGVTVTSGTGSIAMGGAATITSGRAAAGGVAAVQGRVTLDAHTALTTGLDITATGGAATLNARGGDAVISAGLRGASVAVNATNDITAMNFVRSTGAAGITLNAGRDLSTQAVSAAGAGNVTLISVGQTTLNGNVATAGGGRNVALNAGSVTGAGIITTPTLNFKKTGAGNVDLITHIRNLVFTGGANKAVGNVNINNTVGNSGAAAPLNISVNNTVADTWKDGVVENTAVFLTIGDLTVTSDQAISTTGTIMVAGNTSMTANAGASDITAVNGGFFSNPSYLPDVIDGGTGLVVTTYSPRNVLNKNPQGTITLRGRAINVGAGGWAKALNGKYAALEVLLTGDLVINNSANSAVTTYVNSFGGTLGGDIILHDVSEVEFGGGAPLDVHGYNTELRMAALVAGGVDLINPANVTNTGAPATIRFVPQAGQHIAHPTHAEAVALLNTQHITIDPMPLAAQVYTGAPIKNKAVEIESATTLETDNDAILNNLNEDMLSVLRSNNELEESRDGEQNHRIISESVPFEPSIENFNEMIIEAIAPIRAGKSETFKIAPVELNKPNTYFFLSDDFKKELERTVEVRRNPFGELQIGYRGAVSKVMQDYKTKPTFAPSSYYVDEEEPVAVPVVRTPTYTKLVDGSIAIGATWSGPRVENVVRQNFAISEEAVKQLSADEGKTKKRRRLVETGAPLVIGQKMNVFEEASSATSGEVFIPSQNIAKAVQAFKSQGPDVVIPGVRTTSPSAPQADKQFVIPQQIVGVDKKTATTAPSTIPTPDVFIPGRRP